MSRSFCLPVGFAAMLLAASLHSASAQGVGPGAGPVVLGFEQFQDGELLTTQISGLTFSNTIVATAGVSLDELEAPPHSGSNVVEDDGGPITIDFAAPVAGFGGYFNYDMPLTLDAFDAQGAQVGSATSLFSNNFAMSGDPGSAPNEFIQALYPGGISSVTITGDPAGGSFTLDDATITPLSSPPSPAVPEPGPGLLLMAGLGVLVVRHRSRSSRHS